MTIAFDFSRPAASRHSTACDTTIVKAVAAPLLLALALLVIAVASANAQSGNDTNTERRPSTCLAIAGLTDPPAYGPRIWKVSTVSRSEVFAQSQYVAQSQRFAQSRHFAQSMADTVRIRYAVHSTYRMESPQGIVLATDFAGRAGTGRLPDVVTMNHAHGTHYTTSPDPGIPHVLRGWGAGEAPASHYLEVGDVLVRNVTTDIYSGGMLIEADGNSIFIFEMAGLCIGHVGHLHHTLTPEHIAAIGRLDILMIPVDGGLTLSIQEISDLARQFRSSVILPMHWFSGFSLQRFVDNISASFAVDVRDESEFTVSLANLPASPTVIVLQPELGTGFGMGFGDDN